MRPTARLFSREDHLRVLSTAATDSWQDDDRSAYDACIRARELRLPLDAAGAETAISVCRVIATQAVHAFTPDSDAADPVSDDDRVAQIGAGLDFLRDAGVIAAHLLDTLRPESAPKAPALTPETVRELEALADDLEGDALRNHEDDLALCALEIRRFLRTPGIDLLWLLSGAVAKVTDCNLEWAKSKLPDVAVPSAVQSARAANALMFAVSDLCPKAVIS